MRKRLLLPLLLPLCAAAGPCQQNIGSLDKADAATDGAARVGAPCDLQANIGPALGAFNGQALECPSRLCIKPLGVTGGGLCTMACGSDDDCRQATVGSADGQCHGRFVCAVPFEVGRLACNRLCVCNDVLGVSPGARAPNPATCGPTTLLCEFDMATGAYDRNCTYAAPDAGVPDGARLVPAGP